MANRKSPKPATINLTGLDPSPGDANRSEQAASALARGAGAHGVFEVYKSIPPRYAERALSVPANRAVRA